MLAQAFDRKSKLILERRCAESYLHTVTYGSPLMILSPRHELKRFSELTNGELFRMSVRRNPVLAINATEHGLGGQTRQITVLLEDPAGEAPEPHYIAFDSPNDPFVVSYGQQYRFEVRGASGLADIKGDNTVDPSGRLILRPDGPALRVKPVAGTRRIDEVDYHIATGTIRPPMDILQTAVLQSASLVLVAEGRQGEVLATFA